MSMRMRWILDSRKYGYSSTLYLIFIFIFLQQAGGLATPADAGTLTNFVEIGQARDKILSLKLDQVYIFPKKHSFFSFSPLIFFSFSKISGTASTLSGTSTSIDPKGYLTDLNSVVHKTEAEIGDIKRARMLFDSLVKSNPKHAPGWIAAACVEEHAGRMVAARKLIKAGCEQCPKSDDIWLEAARLHVCERFGVFFIVLMLDLFFYRTRKMQRLFSPMPSSMYLRA